MNLPSLWTALITPFHHEGELDPNSFDRLCDKQLGARKSGADLGILLAGSTGEGLALLEHEIITCLERLLERHPKAPIMLGLGGYQLNKQSRMIKLLNRYPIAGYLLPTPLYAKPGVHGQMTWFETLLERAERPCMLYDIPSRSACPLANEVVQALQSHPNFWAIKDASGSMDNIQFYNEQTPEIDVYAGDDALLPNFSQHGAKGLVSVASNIWPMTTWQVMQLAFENHLCEDTCTTWIHASESLFLASNPVPAKMLMAEKGIIHSPMVRPPLSIDDAPSITELLEADEMIQSHFPQLVSEIA